MRWLLLATLAACVSTTPPLTVTVHDASMRSIPGAVVAWVCKPSGDGGAVSDDTGTATVVIFNSEPDDCVVTVAKRGYHTVQRTVRDLASFEVVLEPSP